MPKNASSRSLPLAAALTLCCASGAARAAPKDAPREEEGASRAGSRAVELELHGRVMALAAYERRTLRTFAFDAATAQAIPQRGSKDHLVLGLENARLGAEARVLERVSIVVEADFADGAELKDGFVQYKSKRWLLRAGHFKRPISVFTLESPWRLPLARRGLLQEQLADNLALFGRRVGGTARLKGGGALDPSLTLGVFQSVSFVANEAASPKIDRSEPIDRPALGQQTLVARAAVTPWGSEIAAVFQLQKGAWADLPRKPPLLWTAGGELAVDRELGAGGLRVWAEAYVGTSVYDETPTDFGRHVFGAGRALAAFRFGGAAQGAGFVEPFVMGGALDPRGGAGSDLFFEAVAGVNVGHWRRSRVTLQLELARAGAAFNRSGFFGSGRGERDDLVRHRAVVLETGAAF
jgi:hypothetical protein